MSVQRLLRESTLRTVRAASRSRSRRRVCIRTSKTRPCCSPAQRRRTSVPRRLNSQRKRSRTEPTIPMTPMITRHEKLCMTTVLDEIADLLKLVGQPLGTTEWMKLTRRR